MQYTFRRKQLDDIDGVVKEHLIDAGVLCVLLIDVSGNLITSLDNGKCKHDIYALAALSAGNFGAVSAMAKIIGEEEFSLLFHKGENKSIHFSKVINDFLLISIFGKDVSLGFLRLKVAEVIAKIEGVLEQ